MTTVDSIAQNVEKELAFLGLLDKAHEIYSELGDRAVISYIKSSYKLLSKVYHPDLNPHNSRKAMITQQSLNRLNRLVAQVSDEALLAIIKRGVVKKDRYRNRILIVEDEESIRDAFERILTLEGYDVQTAADGVAGYNVYQAFMPEIILCDIVMPQMNGLDFVARIRKSHPRVKVIYMSGFLEIGPLKERLDSDIERYGYTVLAKPFKPSILLNLIQDLLEMDQKIGKGISVVA
ncbi:MAG: response regulator [Thermodesulfobacteriota bacterium]|nr:response regulator [Thermodesulfobacteriota bacterium]